MDTEDDVYEYDYNDDDDGSLDDDDDSNIDESDIIFEEPESSQPPPPPGNYVIIINEEDIRSRHEQDITEVSDVLSVPRSSAIILLLHHQWRVNDAKSEWYADEEKVRKASGLLEKKPNNYQQNRKAKVACGICFDDYYHDEMYDIAAGCGHLFCGSCWKEYINTSVNDGPGCLRLRCPDPPCNAAVSQDMVYKLVCDEGKKKYSGYLLRSYIEDNKSSKWKWCPGQGCGSAIQFEHDGDFKFDSENCDVHCECTHCFCWNCTEEAHHPVECSTVEKWNIKNTNEGENMTWILAHSKPCPNCKRPIEKNQGCNSMTCSMCRLRFCWICLNSTADHYACNGYDEEDDANTDMGKRRKMAKESIAKYTHYYERWAGNHSSRAKAVEDLKKVHSVHIEQLNSMGSETKTSLEFIADSWKQIIECRRVLKWIYAYGYYLPKHEKTKKQFFEYLQGEAEHGLERLHECAEKELQRYLDGISPLENFNAFRTKLKGLTNVAKNFFENLVRGLENGLSEVDCERERAIEEYKREGRKYGFYNSDNEEDKFWEAQTF
ncbi:hypothetical protein MKW98_021350 [Papaver atlanticum]|uniref:RBR-type E3 ubiquitin transferase n=1 Tax=Papaver atlanticum TaxID=357466 RepID=A0AAD4XK53_9MAGN|nr:hypothetical protein MKW98_021350 [Papaver atlanticum]